MYLVIGEKSTFRTDMQLRSLIMKLEASGLGSGEVPESVSRINVSPLSWAYLISMKDAGLSGELDLSNRRCEIVLRLVKGVADFLGSGTYYFRGSHEVIEDFWSTDLELIHYDDDFFGGLPLKFVHTSFMDHIEIPVDWVNDMVKSKYSDFVLARGNRISINDKLRMVYNSISNVLTVDGPWAFKVGSEDKFMMPTKAN